MKKIISLAIILLMIVSAMAVAVSADSYNYNGPWDLQFELKKADPANVVKDGKIGDGEYERLNVDTDPDSDGCQFWVCYTEAELFDSAEAMMKTMEYYFSWDETHGFNLAVRYKPNDLKQLLSEGTDPACPCDNFLQNCGLQVELNTKEHREDHTDMFYYTIARRTDNGQYLEGHWGQFGLIGSYNPVAGQDYCVEYDFNTGYVTYEWSIPLSYAIKGDIGAGSVFYFSIAATAGTKDAADFDPDDGIITNTYAVGLGNYCYMAKVTNDSSHVTATLLDEVIPGGGSTDGDNGGGNNGGNGSGNNGGNGGNNGGNNSGNNGTVDPVNGDNGGNGDNGNSGSVKTGDAILVLAAVSAVSAAGAFISKKRRG